MAAAARKGHSGRTTFGPTGISFRSSAEAKYAELFTFLNWKWDYEPMDLGSYIPDFLVQLGDHIYPFEIKGADSTTYKLKKDAIKGLHSGLDCSYFILPAGFGSISSKEDCFALYYEYDPETKQFKDYTQSCYIIHCPGCCKEVWDYSLSARSNNCLKCGAKITDFDCSLIHKIWTLINNSYQWTPASAESKYQRNLVKHCKLMLQFINMEIIRAPAREIDGADLYRTFKKETNEEITRENFDNYFATLMGEEIDYIKDKKSQMITTWKGIDMLR